MEPSAFVFDIEKFAVHDGPGIRTVVFLKGCPLRCMWCHNPESQAFEPEIMFTPALCVGCGWCVEACPQQCHVIADGKHTFERINCIGCGKCTEKCYAEALKRVGVRMTVSQVIQEVMKDKLFYDNSGGGLTLSGGEPLSHLDFVRSLFQSAKANGLHTAIETSGFAPWEQIELLLDVIDLWLWDVKSTPERHFDLTGVHADRILANLQRLDASGAKSILRCPLVPNVNDDDTALLHIAELANSLKNVQRIDLEPYHPLGEGKCEQLGRAWENIFHGEFVSDERKKQWREFLQTHTRVSVHV